MKLNTIFIAAVLMFACDAKRAQAPLASPALARPATVTHEVLHSIPDATQTDASDASTEFPRPAPIPVPNPSREARFQAFENFSNVIGLTASGWHCLPIGREITCMPNLHSCERLRNLHVDFGDSVGRCQPSTKEVWCYGATNTSDQVRTANCSPSYARCASTRDSTVAGNALFGMNYRDISQCRAFY